MERQETVKGMLASRPFRKSLPLLNDPHPSTSATALPPLLPVLHMSQVVRQVLQLPMDVLLPGLGPSEVMGTGSVGGDGGTGGLGAVARRDPGLTAHSTTLKRFAVPVSFSCLLHYTNTFRWAHCSAYLDLRMFSTALVHHGCHLPLPLHLHFSISGSGVY